MSITLTSTLQIIRPVALTGTKTSLERAMMEAVAQEHIAQLKDLLAENPNTFQNPANWGTEDCSSGTLPCFQPLTNAAYATVFSSGGQDLRTYTKSVTHNNQTFNITSSLPITGFYRFTRAPYENSFYILVRPTSKGVTFNHQDRFGLSSESCQTPYNAGSAEYTIPTLGNEVITNFRLNALQSTFVQVGAHTACWVPRSSDATGNAACLDDSGLGAASTVNMLNAYAVHIGKNGTVNGGCTTLGTPAACASQGFQQYSLTTLHTGVSAGACSSAPYQKQVQIRLFDTYGDTTADTTLNKCLNTADTVSTDTVIVKTFPAPLHDTAGNYYHMGAVLWLSPANDELRYDFVKLNLSGGTNFVAGSDTAHSAVAGITNLGALDRMTLNQQTGDVVLTNHDQKKLYHFKISAPSPAYTTTNNPSFPTAIGSWDTYTLPVTTVNQFGKPVISKDGEFAIVPAYVTNGGVNQTMIIALNLRGSKPITTATNQPSAAGVRYAILMRFTSAPTGNQGGQITDLNHIHVFHNPVNGKFYWIARPGGTSDNKIYEWSPTTWGNGAATIAQWVQTGGQEINKLTNMRHRGYDPSLAAPVSPEGYTGEFYSVRAYNVGSSLWDVNGTPTVAYSARSDQLIIQAPKTASQFYVTNFKTQETISTRRNAGVDGSQGRNLALDDRPGAPFFDQAAGSVSAIFSYNTRLPYDYSVTNPLSGGSLSTLDNPSAGDGNLFFYKPTQQLYVLDVPSAGSLPGTRPILKTWQSRCVLSGDRRRANQMSNTFSVDNDLPFLDSDVDYLEGVTR